MQKTILFVFVFIVFCIQLVSGFNYFLFPLTMDAQGYGPTFIGVAMAFEVLAIILLCTHIPKVVKYLGVTKAIVVTTFARSFIIYAMDTNETVWGWIVGVFVYGACTSVLLVLLQTWLNMADVGKLRGLILGLYSSALSLGIAAGPVVLQFFPVNMQYHLGAVIALIPLSLLLTGRQYRPPIVTGYGVRLRYVFANSKIVMLSALVGGICFFGLPSFLTLYGLNNGLSHTQATLLLPMFMIGSICAGAVLSAMSGFVDQMKLIYVCVFTSVICAVFLALAVYALFPIAMILLFVWGGCMGGLYAVGLEYIGHTFGAEDQISANTSFVFMDASGGLLGLCVIGIGTDLIGSEGLTYPIIIASVSYLVFITKKSVVNTEAL